MKKFFLMLILIKSLSFAGINSNGFIGSPSDINFEDNKSYSINNEYLTAIASISCGDGSEKITTILDSVDFKSGKFTCLKYAEGKGEPERIDFTIDSARINDEQKALQNFIENNLSSGITFQKQLGSYVFPGASASGATNYISTLDLSSLYVQNKELANLTVNNIPLNISLESGKHSHQTLSNILMGIFTLNSDYFQSDVVDESGNLKIKDLVLDNQNSSILNQQPGMVSKIVRMFVAEKNENVDVLTVSLTDFMDKKFWGYYVYFIANMEQVFNAIIGTLLLFGASFILAKSGHAKVKEKFSEDKQESHSKLSNIGINGFLAIAFFLIPVQTTQIKIPEKFLYEKNMDINSSELYQQSTLVKVTLRYFSDLGSTWANSVSDYGLYAYIRFLESKQGFITSRQITQNESQIKKLYEDIFYLKKDFDFLNFVCKPAFSDYLASNQRFNSVSKDAFEQLNSPFSVASSSIGESLRIDRINPALCQKLENDVFLNSRKILSNYAYLKQQLKINKSILSSENSEDQKIGFKNFVDLIQFQQNNFGWINIVSVPMSYNLFFQNATPVFNEDIATEKIKESNDYNIISAWSKNEPDKLEIKNSIDDSVLASILGHIQSKFVWFIIPGFDSMYNIIHKYFQNVAGLDPTARQLKQTESNLDGALNSVKYFVGGAVGGPLGVLAGSVMSVVSSFSSFIGKAVTSGLEYGALIYVSLVVSIFMMTITVSSVFMIVISTATIVKVVLYYMEAIILIIMADVMIFWALVTGNKNYFEKFTGKSLIVLILAPITIVFASYIYIFLTEAATELYLMCVGMTFDTMVVANQTIIQQSDNSFVNGLNAMVSAVSLKALGTVVIGFFSMLMGVFLIFKLKDIFLGILGINAEDSNFSKVTEMLQNKLTGDAVKV